MESTGITCIVILLLCSSCLGANDLTDSYKFSAPLSGDDYILHWNFNRDTKRIQFAVNVSTLGWVGFGVSPTGQMPGSDVVIGWVDASGTLTFHDRFASSRSLPSIDSSQDWSATRGYEENGRTILEFYRNFTSCDEDNDLDITADTARVVWSYHSQDPSSLAQLGSLVHEQKGSTSLNLLGGSLENRVESNSDSFSIVNDNILIPSNQDTTYWCTVHELPQAIEQQERYMYKFSPVIHAPAAMYVHHIIVYLCTNLNGTQVGASQECIGNGNIEIEECRRSGIIFAGWAVGGAEFVFPSGVAFPFGGSGGQYIVLEIHYDNPNLDSGVRDSSGIEFLYISEEPANRAGLLTLGHSSSSAMMIPPRAENYVVNAICPGQCTQHFFPPEGINIFANLLHTHLAGYGLTVRHFRETSSCNGLEELPPIDENTRYDFNFQQTTHLPRTVQVLPGDTLHLECSYRTTDPAYQSMVLGGESTREEMCFSFLYYYPETDLSYCVGAQIVSDTFTAEHFNSSTQAALLTSIQRENQKEIKRIFQNIEWTSEMVTSFENSVHTNDYGVGCVDSRDISRSIGLNTREPEVKCPYEAPRKDCSVVGDPIDGAPHVNFYVPLMFITIITLWLLY